MDMEELPRDDGFAATFVVSTPRAEAWKRLVEAEPPGPIPEGEWWVPAVEGTAAALEVEPESVVRLRKTAMPCEGTEIVMTFEDEGTGTRITFVQNGFGPRFGTARPWLEAGWWAIRADLFVFFEHGVSPRRHTRPWTGLGCEVTESPGGLLVTDVGEGTFAAEAGLAAGDLILLLSGSPVVNVRELAAVSRSMRTGDSTRVRWLRDGTMMSGTGTF